MHSGLTLHSLCALALLAGGGAAANAQSRPVLVRDSFSIGNGDGVLCQVQDRSVGNPARTTMFDRRWAVVCRDSARAVGTLYAFRGASADAEARIAPLRRDAIDCSAMRREAAPGVAGAERRVCRVTGTDLDWSITEARQGDTHFVAEGFSAYDSATLLALRSIMANQVVDGSIDVATTSVSDPEAFARVQAETLEPQQALGEGYRRNLGGEYAEAAAYFETLQERLEGDDAKAIEPAEFLVNRALQKSNLGQFAEADRLFAEADALGSANPVVERLLRNFEAIHLLNEGDAQGAIVRLDQPIRSSALDGAALVERMEISQPIADRLNGSDAGLFGFRDELKLTPRERAEILDAQALQLRGTALRLNRDDAGARAALLDAYSRAIAVRDGRVTSITRLRAQVLGDLAWIAERGGDPGQAETYLRNGLTILEAEYPERKTVSAARARLAAFLLRQGRESDAMALYQQVIDDASGKRNAVTGFANQLAPYFRSLAPKVANDPQAAEAFFKATQVLIRPGVAETQAVLARELSARNDDAARLFRQSTDLARDIERNRIRYQALGAGEQLAANAAARAELAAQIETLEALQLRTQASLNAYPQYRVVAPRSLSLGEFREALEPGEAYTRLATIGGELFMFYADKADAKAWRVDMPEADLDLQVDLLRASISTLEGGQYVTYPYDIENARLLYRELFGPVAEEMSGIRHLVFEPDGAMLRLPIDILVADDASVQTYLGRIAAGGDEYDFTGVDWLARNREVSTAVSAQAFVDARRAPRSTARQEYLGLGENQPVGDTPPPQVRAVLASGSDDCGWTAREWNHPIDDAELISARALIGAGQSELITGPAFTDAAIKAKPDLDQFRVLHFATHGLVTPPHPSCPVRPALLTSFGGAGSDGLLSFEEIFDLDLDADVIILSACDTAGSSSIEANRAAGVGSDGGTALDGLVRSFIGAGGRSVVASHWPAPDQYRATERLMDGMFRAGAERDLGTALRQSQAALMDDPVTSHPYYWGGFSVIGDAARPLLSTTGLAAAATPEDAALAR